MLQQPWLQSVTLLGKAYEVGVERWLTKYDFGAIQCADDLVTGRPIGLDLEELCQNHDELSFSDAPGPE